MNAKKLLSILLCLVMMCTLLPMTALAEGETIITHVDIINAPTLVAGQKLNSFSAQCATPGITITRPDGNNGFQVWDVTGGTTGVVNGNTVIEAGHTYSIRVFVKVNDGYLFPYNGTVTSTINGSTASTGYVGGYDTSNHKYRSISLDITVPEAPAAAVTGISIAPASASVEQGKTLQFTATVSGTGDFNKNVAWSVSGAASTIDANGLLTVGAAETAATLTVTATAEGDTAKTASATVTVTEPAPPDHTHTPVLQPGQAPTCTVPGWMDCYECKDCGYYTDEGCSDEIKDLQAWRTGDGMIPASHGLLPKYNETHHWSECALEDCPDREGSKSEPEAHQDTDPKDYTCDICYYDMRTKLASVPITMTGLRENAKLENLTFTPPAGVKIKQTAFLINVNVETLDAEELPASTAVEYGKEYWAALLLSSEEGCAFPDPEPGYFTLNGASATVVFNNTSEPVDDGDSVTLDQYSVLFKLPVLAASAHAHSYAQDVYKHDDTYHWQECGGADCDNLAGSVINKAKHTGGKATCLAKATCSVCGEEYGKKLAHDYSDWVVVKEPTDTTYGKKERTCSMCKGVHMEYIPPLGQNPQTGDTNDVFLWSAALAASVLGLTGVVVCTKKKKREE